MIGLSDVLQWLNEWGLEQKGTEEYLSGGKVYVLGDYWSYCWIRCCWDSGRLLRRRRMENIRELYLPLVFQNS